MKKLIFPILLGLFGLVAFLLQLEIILVVCETLCLAIIVWQFCSKKLPIRVLPLIVSALVVGALLFSQASIGKWVDMIWPHTPVWLPDEQPQEELPWMARCLLYRPYTWFYRVADALMGLCLSAILMPWFKHLTEKHLVSTSVIMAVMFLLSAILLPFGIDLGLVLGIPFAAYCVTLMVIDFLAERKNMLFLMTFLSVLAFSLFVTLVVAIRYHLGHNNVDMVVVIEWIVMFSAPLCASLMYIVWPLRKKRIESQLLRGCEKKED